MPKLSSILHQLGLITDIDKYRKSEYGRHYSSLLTTMFDIFDHTRPFRNYLASALTSEYVRLLKYPAHFMSRLEIDTPGDYLVLPIQSGVRYAGFTPRRAIRQVGRQEQ